MEPADVGEVMFSLSYPGREVTASVYNFLTDEGPNVLSGVVPPSSATFADVQTGSGYRFEVWVEDPESGELALSHRSWFERQLDAPDVLSEEGLSHHLKRTTASAIPWRGSRFRQWTAR